MAIMHLVVLTATLLTLLLLPCIVAVVICTDGVLDRAARQCGRRRDRRALRRLDRSLDTDRPVPDSRTDIVLGPTIEQLAADLRRLDRQRNGGLPTESAVWLAAVVRAYDDRLRLASRCLGVPEHLQALEGIDRDIERVRVEGALQTAGLQLRSVSHRQL